MKHLISNDRFNFAFSAFLSVCLNSFLLALFIAIATSARVGTDEVFENSNASHISLQDFKEIQ